MLAHARSLLSYHRQALVGSFKALTSKPFTTIMIVAVLAVALVLPALFWVVLDNLSDLTNTWQDERHIRLYLDQSLDEQQAKQALYDIQRTDGVAEARLTLPDAGWAQLQSQEGMEQIMQHLSHNPLPSVIDVVPSLAVNSPWSTKQLFIQLKMHPKVAQAKLDMQWINKIHAIMAFLSQVSYAIMMLLSFAVVVIIGNTLRLAIYNRFEEIQVLKLIGASDQYITRPFLYMGFWYGLFGALLALCLMTIFLSSLSSAIGKLASVYHMHYPLIGLSLKQMLIVIIAASFLGWLGARLSVKRHLSCIEPYQ